MAMLYSARWHRARAAYMRTLPGPKAKRAAELGELVARLIERKDRENRARLADLVEVAGPPLVPGNR
jgi:hypothetical protein